MANFPFYTHKIRIITAKRNYLTATVTRRIHLYRMRLSGGIKKKERKKKWLAHKTRARPSCHQSESRNQANFCKCVSARGMK